MEEVLDILPIAAAARHIGICYPWLRTLVTRGEVRVLRDRAGRLYLPMPEVERLGRRYEQHLRKDKDTQRSGPT